MLLALWGSVPIVALGVMAVWEFLFPCRVLMTPRLKRWPHNLAFIVVKKLFFRFILPIAVPVAAHFATRENIGIMNILSVPLIIAIPVTFCILDFLQYAIHYSLHHVPWMWRLHRVHHSDTDLDVTTATRSHPFDDTIYFTIHSIAAVAFGMPAVGVVAFQIYGGVVSKFSHGNIKLPERVEKFLHNFVVTPDMHRVHHSARVKETDSNFSIVIPWWDSLFGTYCPHPKDGHEGMIIGLETFRESEEQTVLKLLLHPLFPNRVVPENWEDLARRKMPEQLTESNSAPISATNS